MNCPASRSFSNMIRSVSEDGRPRDSVTPTIATHSAAVPQRGWLRCLPVILPLAVLLITGFRGLDFGVHWDERYYQIAPAQRMLNTGTLRPGYYGYPSFDYWVNLAALLPEVPGVLA